MPAELPFDQDVDRAHVEARRARRRRYDLLVANRKALRRAGGTTTGQKRPRGAPPETERASLRLTSDELHRIERAAKEAQLSRENFIRCAALHFVHALEEIDR